MKKLNKFIILLFLYVTANFPSYGSGIVVFDANASVESARQWAKEAKQWMETAQHYRTQIQAYKAQLATATGLRDIQGLVSQAKGIRNDIKALQKQGISLTDLIMSDGPVTGDAKRLYERFKDFDDCDEGVKAASSSYASACEKSALNKGYVLQQTLDVQSQVNRALNEIGQLSNRIANAKDSKESQDLANAIQAKSIQLNTLTHAWEMNVKAAEQRDKMAEKKKKRAFKQQQLNAPIPKYTPLN